MSQKTYSLPIISAITLVVFIVVVILFQPGELDLISPQHSDYYRYFMASESRWLPTHWLAPRPLSLAYVKIAGIFHRPDILFMLLSLPAMCFIVSLAYVTIKSGLIQGRMLPLVAFYFVSFGSPFFYLIFQFDFGGMLSGFFAVLAISFGLKVVKEKNDSSAYWWSMPMLFTMLSIESKPTYSFSLLLLAFIGSVLIKGYKSKAMFLGVLFILGWVFIKDKLLGSPFVASSSTVSPYAVVINPIKNIQVLAFYMKNAFTLPLFCITLLASMVLLFYRKWKLLGVFVVLAISASIPMALLVNRQWDTYAWYSTVIIGVLIMVAVSHLLVEIDEGRNIKNKALATITLLLISIGLVTHALSQHNTVEWTLSNQHYNRNVLSALNLISNGVGEQKILIAGIQWPYNPFKNTEFINRVFPKIGKFDVLLRKNERVWNEMSHEQTNGIYLDKVNWSDYSTIYIFDKMGHIVAKQTTDNIKSMPQYKQSLLLYCEQLNENGSSDPTSIAKAIECLNNNEEYNDSIALGKIVFDLGEKQPLIYFYLAKSYQATGDTQKAIDLLNKALKLEPGNILFLSTLTENQSKINKGIINAN
jgi:hypothetical protein